MITLAKSFKKHTREQLAEIIFKKYMEEAFDVKAFHYLVKPIDELKFRNVFFRAVADCKRTKEEKARLEKAMKEEDEAKAKKRAEEKRLNEIALNKYLQPISYAVPQLNILSSNNPEEYLFQTPANIDISTFQSLVYRSKNN